MNTSKIDAVYHAEERYSKLSLAYTTEAQRQQIENALSTAQDGCSLTPSIYTSSVTGDRHVIVIEYHDDYDRQAGQVFDKILDTLGITICQ
jgi:hypothetical protein